MTALLHDGHRIGKGLPAMTRRSVSGGYDHRTRRSAKFSVSIRAEIVFAQRSGRTRTSGSAYCGRALP
jgi:hypothetical protein